MLTQKRYSQEEFISVVLNKKKNISKQQKMLLRTAQYRFLQKLVNSMYDYVEVYFISLTFNVKLINSTF